MSDYGNFGPLIGVIHVSNTHCRFMIYSTQNAEILTSHDLKIKQIIHNAGWCEYDPNEIWKNTLECIEVAYKNLVILEISPHDIIAVGICNMRGTTVLWDKETGLALHNAIGWTDCRCISLLSTMLNNVKRNVNYLREYTGLPISTCFSALKIKWLIENNSAVRNSLNNETLFFGTIDSWLLWNLTGSETCGVHSTDITNAQYTGLMNINTLKWDVNVCGFYKIPMGILPRIRSNSEIYGYIIEGPLSNIPIASVNLAYAIRSLCIGDQPAALLGQLSLKAGQNVCSLDDSCFVLLNTGQEFVESENGLLSIISYKLGPNAKNNYALEGAISNAGSTINWLTNGLRINTEINSNDNVVEVLNTFLGESSMISSSCSSNMLNTECGVAAKRSEITFVPAFHGLYAPYWRYDARGIILGLTSQTTAENVSQAAYEATGFQIHEVLEAFKRDTKSWNWANIIERLVFGGEYAENSTFIQFIADIVGIILERPQTTAPSGLGAMICAGITMEVINETYAQIAYMPPSDAFSPTTTPNRRSLLYKRWEYAVKKCLNWDNYENFESDLALFAQRECDTNLPLRLSLPGSIFLTSTFVFLIVAKFFQNQN